MDSINYIYNKTRKNFGRQPLFAETPVQILDTINPDRSMQKQYILRNPVHSEVQASRPQTEQYVNTKRFEYQHQGANHAEGGWPKDIHFFDEEATSRYRRRVERDDGYVNAVLGLQSTLEYYINQNNSIELYEMYFKEMEETKRIESFSLKVNNVYRDAFNRPIGCISWTIEDNPKIVVAYCNKRFPSTGPVNTIYSCSIWDIENSNYPISTLEPPVTCWQLVCSPVTPSIIVGGLEDGRVCIFDIRCSMEPVCISEFHLAHRDPVSALVYITSRLNNEFFSGSTDGRCMWYDIRNIKVPTENMIMSIRVPPGEAASLANAEGVTTLQYDRAFPTRFLCGTDTGFVINVNRKGKSLNEIMSATFSAHRGPVRAIHRSPCTSKVFITCGDWSTHIWSEEVITSPIITGTQQRYQVFDVAWTPNRLSSYMTVSGDGKFRYWDVLRKLREPIAVLPLTKCALIKIKPNEEGRMIAMGDAKGALHLVSLSESLVRSADRDKSLMSQTYEREARRERILENRVKEIYLKLKVDDEKVIPRGEVFDEEAEIKAVEDEYRRVVQEEMRGAGVISRPYTGKTKLRSR